MSRFKTELCNNLIELGSCKYGDRCHYAHGAHELRQVSRRHPKYRTERCKNFELTGKCPFGPRCSYVHPKPDLDSMIEQLSKYMKHTKAPKPDSEDDDHEINSDDNMSLYTASKANTINSTSSINSNISKTSILRTNFNNVPSNTHKDIYDENKENQDFVNYHNSLAASTATVTTNSNLSSMKSIYHQSPTSPVTKFNASTLRKQRFINSLTPSNSNNHTASNPFGIRNPLSDYINNTNINGKSPLKPNKQFYTRF